MSSEAPAYVPDPIEVRALIKQAEAIRFERNWNRLGRIVLHDALHQSGVYGTLPRRDRKIHERALQFAIDPKTPQTKREIRRDKRGYSENMGWAIPLLPVVTVVAGALKTIDMYGKSNLPGHAKAAGVIDSFNRHEAFPHQLRDEKSLAVRSSLYPQVQLANMAVRSAIEPATFIIRTGDMLEAAEARIAQRVPKERFDDLDDPDHLWVNLITELAPNPLSLSDRRELASQVFMGSQLLQNGELGRVNRENKAQLIADGPNRFRVEVTQPYADIYATNNWYSRQDLWREEPVSLTDPLVELLADSRV